ncbi:restriction endonuclease subunit M [Methanosphaera sp. BMS]|uniref:restriction endonuclease subunit M n=1 Tax=Methanosphaera sp. BMS TaxID=1789762 RepID=UPI000DC1ECB0|nr:restriction endonuclease subunit M [Methanosphaera sp. BMS]AWX31856.1 restriction endonuclease subunit M [Methanosphaera sp. BMS]
MNILGIDIKEKVLKDYYPKLLTILLKDHSSNKNIIWATDDYKRYGKGYEKTSRIFSKLITGDNGYIIKPRIKKTDNQQTSRSRDNGEVFTPSWICNKQNNLIDEKWFNYKYVFNQENGNKWETNTNKIKFPKGKRWQDYIMDIRLEITCGEAPYIVSRYDTVTGNYINIKDRIGLLDRKLRIVSENTDNQIDWLYWAKKSIENIYAYEFQGDNLLLARENILFTFIDYFNQKFDKNPDFDLIYEIANIISWNIFQMDGLKYVVPYSCQTEKKIIVTLFGKEVEETQCIGCKKDYVDQHNGVYSKIKDWETGKTIKFIDLINKGEI